MLVIQEVCCSILVGFVDTTHFVSSDSIEPEMKSEQHTEIRHILTPFYAHILIYLEALT